MRTVSVSTLAAAIADEHSEHSDPAECAEVYAAECEYRLRQELAQYQEYRAWR